MFETCLLDGEHCGLRDVVAHSPHSFTLVLQEEHWQEMEEVLVKGTFKGLSAIQELRSSLTATTQTQRVLAQKVGPRLSSCIPAVFSLNTVCESLHPLSQVEAMKETGMFFGNLVQDLAQLREATVLGLQSLQAEQHKLEEEIRKAQERHQTVRESQVSH